MALICGAKGLFPCPICLIPRESFNNLHITAPLQTANETDAILEQSRNASTKGKAEKILKSHGAWDVKVDIIFLSFNTYYSIKAECIPQSGKF